MSFDPNNVRRYVIESRGQGDPGAVLVAARDFDQLLALHEATRQELDISKMALAEMDEDYCDGLGMNDYLQWAREQVLKEERK